MRTERGPKILLQQPRSRKKRCRRPKTLRFVRPSAVTIRIPQFCCRRSSRGEPKRDSLFKVCSVQSRFTMVPKDGIKNLKQNAHIDLGTSIHHLFQGLSESLPGTDDWGTATDMDITGSWALTKRGKPTQGSLTMHLETRWNWGTTGPMSLGPQSLGMVQSTGNTYESYVPAMIIRNFYWQMGSTKSKWALRLGKVTIDGILGTTKHLTPTYQLPVVRLHRRLRDRPPGLRPGSHRSLAFQ